MALVINDRVKENSTTSGTGDITLAGVASGQGNKKEFLTRLKLPSLPEKKFIGALRHLMEVERPWSYYKWRLTSSIIPTVGMWLFSSSNEGAGN